MTTLPPQSELRRSLGQRVWEWLLTIEQRRDGDESPRSLSWGVSASSEDRSTPQTNFP